MAYYTNLFSPETFEIFSKSDQTVTGFRIRQQNSASRVRIGDKLICYMTKLSRWVGILEVTSEYFISKEPIFSSENDPFIVRFKVKPVVWLLKENCVPIHDDRIWNNLSFTKDINKKSAGWTGKVRASLSSLDGSDGKILEKFLLEQNQRKEKFDIDEQEYRKYFSPKVRTTGGVISVSIPETNDYGENGEEIFPKKGIRESLKIQALLAKIGTQMGFNIWIPRNDKARVLDEWKDETAKVLDMLPLNYDDATLKTIEQIDLIWLKGRSIIRAFEVEHTTSIYSGILRMADLLALQPNMDIKLHIVAPEERKEKVFQEILRPVFSLLDRGPLSESCTYISYDAVEEISAQKYLSHFSDSLLDEFSEQAE